MLLMSAKSENMDLNSDVVLSDHETEAMAEKSRLSGQRDIGLGGGSSMGEGKEVNDIRVSESVDEAKEEKVEGFSIKERVEEDKGSALAGLDCVNEVGVEKMKEICVGAEKDEEGFAEKERNGVEGSGAKLDETSCSPSLEAEKEEETLAEEKKNTVEDSGARLDEMNRLQSLEAGKEEENLAEKERNSAEDSGVKLGETSSLQSLVTEKGKENSAKKEKSVVDNSGAKLEEMSCLQSHDADKDKEDLAEKEINKVEDLGTLLDETSRSHSLEAEKEKEDLAEKGRNAVEDLGAKIDETSCPQSLEAEDDKEDITVELDETSRSESLEAEKDKEDLAEKERNSVEDLSEKLDETSRSQTLEAEEEKEDMTAKLETSRCKSLEAEKDKEDLAEKERNSVEDLSGKLDDTSRSLTLEAEEDKEDVSAKLDETSHSESLEAEKHKEDLAEKERNSVEDLSVKLDETSRSKSFEAEKDNKDLAEKKGISIEDSGAKLDEMSHSQNIEAKKEKKDISEKESDDIEDLGTEPDITSHSQSQRPCISEVLESEAVETTESARESTEAVPVVEGEMKADDDESFPKEDSEVIGDCETADSDGLQQGTLEANLKAEQKGRGSGSDSIDIVIDLNPKKGTGKGASRNGKANSVPSKAGFSFGDLIWAKVRSHPWWPGQVCDPSAATRKAKKYFKKGTYLIAYYGDNSFAWNEPSQIKPFLEHFSQMEKQSNTEDFHYAIDCALEEVSRRVEFSLACPCLSEEVYSQINSQIIVNAGIREDSSRIVGGDSSLTAASFQPDKLVKYIQDLAQNPNDSVDGKLEFAVARSELLAFSRWKGYSCLPEFTMLGAILENDAEVVLPSKDKHCDEATQAADKPSKGNELVSEKEKLKPQNSSAKRKLNSKESAHLGKKKKSLSDLMVDKPTKTPVRKNGQGSKVSDKKRKASDAVSVDFPVKGPKTAAMVVDNKPPPNKQSFRVGERISKIASQLNGLSPILKNGNGKCNSTQPQTNSKKEGTLFEESEPKKLVETQRPSDETLSQPSSEAEDPTRENSLPSDDEDNQSLEDLFGCKTGKKSSKNGKKMKRPGVTELPHRLGLTTKSYWSERIGKSIPEDQDETVETRLGMSKKEKRGDPEPESDSREKTSGEKLETETSDKKPADISEGHSKDNSFPTALILKFADSDSVPSETNLNKIFSSYESLDKSKTEVLKNNCAQVVFSKRSDAETAFSSSGKYSTFGPALVSYRLKHLSASLSSSSPSGKASQNSKKRSKKSNSKASEENKAQ